MAFVAAYFAFAQVFRKALIISLVIAVISLFVHPVLFFIRGGVGFVLTMFAIKYLKLAEKSANS